MVNVKIQKAASKTNCKVSSPSEAKVPSHLFILHVIGLKINIEPPVIDLLLQIAVNILTNNEYDNYIDMF